jgi:hypothetical protein
VLAVIGWFGALFTGRLPVFAADFLTGYLRWQTRVAGYTILLTDVYPPFSLDDADYPIRVAVAPGELNRLAVLFRYFLLVPCLLVQLAVSLGAFTIMQLVSWLTVLITGEMPAVLHQAFAAVLRFQVRINGFALMLTSTYPAELFGDPAAPWSPTGHGAQQDNPWLLALSGGARKLVGAFIGLGVLLAVGGGVTAAIVSSQAATTIGAENQLQTAITPVRNVINNYSTSLTACKGSLACVTKLDRDVAATMNTSAARVRAIHMPSAQTRAGAVSLASSLSHSASIFARLGAVTNPAKYGSVAGSAGLQQSVDQVNNEYLLLGGMLAH